MIWLKGGRAWCMYTVLCCVSVLSSHRDFVNVPELASKNLI